MAVHNDVFDDFVGKEEFVLLGRNMAVEEIPEFDGHRPRVNSVLIVDRGHILRNHQTAEFLMSRQYLFPIPYDFDRSIRIFKIEAAYRIQQEMN